MTPEFWNGRRVFLTGHTGFKGAWLSLWLHRLGARVTGFSLGEVTSPSLFAAAGVSRRVESVIGDVRDPGALIQALESASPEIVLHLAAQALVRRSYQDPLGTYATNVLGTAHLLEAAGRCPAVRVVVAVTSDKCYENREAQGGYRETDLLGGADPYSSSKACAELVAAAWRRSFFASEASPAGPVLATVRAGNVIGGGDWAPDRIIPDCVRALADGREICLRYPAAIRPWQFVLEPLRGYLEVAERCYPSDWSYGEAWNFGPRAADARPVSWLVERFSALTGGRLRFRVDAAPQPHETGHLALDCTKAAERLSWYPALDAEQALRWTAAWYEAYLGGADMAAVTERQLGEYEEVLGPVPWLPDPGRATR